MIGHFDIGTGGKADVCLAEGATHFVVVEAKMFSGLSSGVTNAPYYDQAARTVACIAEVLRLKDRRPSDLSRLGFYVLAPKAQIKRGLFSKQLDRESIRAKVKQCVDAYEGERDDWYSEWFQPILAQTDIRPASWEDLIGEIGPHDSPSATSIQEFYDRCIEFNR